MEKSFYKTYFEAEKNHWWFKVRRNIVLSLIEKYKIPKTAKIFDFGCGSGCTVGYLQKLGYDASGSDVSAEAIEFGLSRGIPDLSIAQRGEISPPEGGFDLILALDVIEHIQDDSGSIRIIEKALKTSGGKAIITVPAYQWLWGVQDDVAHHYRRYTAGSLAKVLNKNKNLEILRETYFNTFLFPPIAIVRVLSQWFNLKERESDFDINNQLLNNILYFIFNFERIILKHINFYFGVSILAIVRKK